MFEDCLEQFLKKSINLRIFLQINSNFTQGGNKIWKIDADPGGAHAKKTRMLK